MNADLVLSSGLLAFARHLGVLRAIERKQAQGLLQIDAVCGTSSGALMGALWAAGLTTAQLEAELAGKRPMQLLTPHWPPWRGAFSLEPLLAYVRQRLPATFADLPMPLAVGVIDEAGQHRLLSDGPLAEAVVASCAMPKVFAQIRVAGVPYADGGAADRLALGPWRQWRPGRQAIAHQVARTAGVDQPADLHGITLIQTPRSGANFLSLGDFAGQLAEAEQLAWQGLAALGPTGR